MKIKNINLAHAAVQSKKTTNLEIADHIIAKHEEFKHLNAFCRFNPEQIRHDANVCDERLKSEDLPLAGLFLAVKDCLDVKGLPTGDGTAALQGNIAKENNIPLQNLLNLGAIIAGKTNLHELGFGITSNNAFSGPVRNPFNPNMIVGGSSGGTAAAIGAGIVSAGLGTDCGGSCRIPASLCNCYGYRPSMIRYEKGGAVGICNTRDTIDPLASNLETLLRMDSVMSGGNISEITKKHCSSLRLGIDPIVHIEKSDSSIRNKIIETLKKLESAGAKIIEINVSDYMKLVEEVSFPLVFFETKREVTAYLATLGMTPDNLIDGIKSPDVKDIFENNVFGKDAPSESSYNHIMNVLRPQLIDAYTALLKNNNLDALIFPTTPLPARPIGHDETVDLNGEQVPTFLTYVQNADLCTNVGASGVSMPIGFTADGLPIGIEVDGYINDDLNLLSVASSVDNVINV